MKANDILPTLKETFSDWSEDKAPRLAAALAYYTVFSLAPLLLIAISIASLVYTNADNELKNRIAQIIPGGGDAVLQLLDAANKQGRGGIAAIIGFVTLLFGAGGLFGQLQDALDTIWEVQPKPNQGIVATIKQRFFSFSMVLGTGFLLLVSLLVTSVLSAAINYFSGLLPGIDIVWQIVNFLVSFALSTAIFALIFKVVPDAEIRWGDVWIGAAVTAALFMLGQFVLSLYLSNQSSAYGAFGSLIVLLLWVYYAAQILFFGAEFTQVYTNKFGSRIQPASNAMPITEEARAQQGIPSKDDGGPDHGMEREVGGTTRNPGPTRGEPVVAPSVPPKPGALTTAAGFVLGLIIGRRGKTPR